MNKSILFYVISIVVGITAVVIICLSCINYVFFLQYNNNYIGRRLVIHIDRNIGKEYICTNSGYEVYSIHLKNAYFVDFHGNRIDIKDGLSSEKVTIKDMIAKLKKVSADSVFSYYLAENYQIILSENKCFIAPFDFDESLLKDIE